MLSWRDDAAVCILGLRSSNKVTLRHFLFSFFPFFCQRNGTAPFLPVRSPTQLSGRHPLLPSDRLLCRRRCKNPFNLYCHSPTVHYCRFCRSDVLQRGCRAVEPCRRFNEQTYLERFPSFGEKGKRHLPVLGTSDLNICDAMIDMHPLPHHPQIQTVGLIDCMIRTVSAEYLAVEKLLFIAVALFDRGCLVSRNIRAQFLTPSLFN